MYRHVTAAVVAIAIALWSAIATGCAGVSAELDPRLPVAGIDISAHNGPVDFEAVRADSVDFVLIKATEGATFKDTAFYTNHSRALAAGLHVGAYHFFRFETNGLMQALNLLNSVRGLHLDLPLIIDIEEWGNPNACPTPQIVGRLREMLSYLESQGYPVMLYTNRDGHARFIRNQLERYPLWICSFTDPPLDQGNDRVIIWQYSHNGQVAGVNGPVDRNSFMGTRDQYRQWLKSLTFPPQYYE